MADEPQSVEDYRLDQIEKEIAALKSDANSLSFGQIKQMFAYLGLPVAIATGVFGVALWQSIEIGTVTAAEQRADQKISEITQEINDLGRRVADLATSAQSTIEDLREIQGRAEGSALAVRERANEARERVSLAEEELEKLRVRIDAVPQVASLTESIESAARGLADQPGFQSIVASKALEPLTGLVAAFDLEKGCPAGWSELTDARGRMILGANPDGEFRYKPRPFRGLGGEEMHKLTPSEMPSHQHGENRVVIRTGPPGSGPYYWFTAHDERRGLFFQIDPPQAGGDQPHNNMPPYIALYFCKKEG